MITCFEVCYGQKKNGWNKEIHVKNNGTRFFKTFNT